MMDLQTKEEEGSTAGPSRVASALARTSEGTEAKARALLRAAELVEEGLE
jgi:hypothetical protein